MSHDDVMFYGLENRFLWLSASIYWEIECFLVNGLGSLLYLVYDLWSKSKPKKSFIKSTLTNVYIFFFFLFGFVSAESRNDRSLTHSMSNRSIHLHNFSFTHFIWIKLTNVCCVGSLWQSVLLLLSRNTRIISGCSDELRMDSANKGR